jgi:hypothetical protein
MHSFDLCNHYTFDENELVVSKPFSEYFIIIRTNNFYQAWSFVYVVICVISSYFYGFVASDDVFHASSELNTIATLFEVFFALTMIFEFLVSF